MPREDSDEEVYGPVLPPKMKESRPEEESRREEPKAVVGPALPVSLQTEQNLEEVNDDFFGPALPPHLLKRKREEEQPEDEEIIMPEEKKNFVDDDDEDDEDDIVGPIPAGTTATSSFTQQKLEERAWRLKNEFLTKNNQVEEKKREEWMTELPPAHSAASFGLGPRKFKTREGPDMSDRSCWTDTPADREKKRMERLNNASYEKPRKDKKKDKTRERDREDREDRKSKKKERSLLEIHQEKMKKEQKRKEKEAKESGRTLRRPFDRDIDLKVGGLSEKDKKSIFAKSQLLDDRFCHSKS